jgi:hypothetical protein
MNGVPFSMERIDRHSDLPHFHIVAVLSSIILNNILVTKVSLDSAST